MKKIVFAIVIMLLFAAGCGSAGTDEEYNIGLFAMDTYITIDIYGENPKETAEKMSRKINELENLWSATLETSEIYEINNSQGRSVTVSDETMDIIRFSLDMAAETGGAFNPALYPIVKEWGFTTGNYKIPDKRTIDDLLQYTDYSNITVNANEIRVNENTELDLGAVGKGYTGDIVAEIAENSGISGGIINLGGNVQAIGTKADGAKWRLGLQDPFGDGNIGILEVADCAVVTSGNYEKYFTGEDGKRYCHIIDPKTGYPVENGLASVTVVGKEGKKCDVLSTALFVMGMDNAIEYWKDHEDFEMILITENGEIYITPDLRDSFSVTDENTVVNLIDKGGSEKAVGGKHKMVVVNYTGHSEYTPDDPPTFSAVGDRDAIAMPETMEKRISNLKSLGIPAEFHLYPNVRNGFGPGTGTNAEGWINDAVKFWEENK